jgi:hypothetical protein
MNEPQDTQPPADPPVRRGFPDPSITLVEFGGALGVLIAERTERDGVNRRLVLRKVAYVRSDGRAWGVKGYAEVWIQQNKEGVFLAVEPASNKFFRYPSRPRYEVAFVSREIFDCAIQCLKERTFEPFYELLIVTFGGRPGFSVESGCLLASEDYAGETSVVPPAGWVADPMPAPAG